MAAHEVNAAKQVKPAAEKPTAAVTKAAAVPGVRVTLGKSEPQATGTYSAKAAKQSVEGGPFAPAARGVAAASKDAAQSPEAAAAKKPTDAIGQGKAAAEPAVKAKSAEHAAGDSSKATDASKHSGATDFIRKAVKASPAIPF